MSRIEKLQEFLAKDPDDSFVRHALALEYQKIGDLPTARKLFEDLLAHDPAAVGSYYHLGKLLEGIGERELALEWYEKGMAAAKTAIASAKAGATSGGMGSATRAFNELRSAYDELMED